MNQNEYQKMIPLLLEWYEKNKRPLPWRNEPTPYHVWISEIMLQQTRIEAVIPYYERFLKELPDIKSLSEASDDKLMKLWEGLGYYSRARNLKKAAITIMKDHDGELPKTAKELRSLSGIGDYTAGAIASICFGEPEPAVDGNVLRVMMRYLGKEDDITLQSTKKALAEHLRAVYPTGDDAKNLTSAIMELGESICIPNGEAKCEHCPLSTLCVANQQDLKNILPVKSAKKARKKEEKTVFLLSFRGTYAILQRPDKGLLAKLWEFPNVKDKLSEMDALSYLHSLSLSPISIRPTVEAVHIFTHIEWHMTGYAAECAYPSSAFVWKTADEILADYAIPGAFRAYLDIIKELR